MNFENDNENALDFKNYNLRPELLNALEQKNFKTPMPVQDCVLSSDYSEKDLIVRAKTGSGKTLAFLLPLLNNLEKNARTPQILILAPTRELAQQTADESEFLGGYLNFNTASLVGGMDIVQQLKTLKKGAAVIAGTPGRVRDHLNRGSLKPDEIKAVVLDEGDLMLDMGFRDELEYILNVLPNGQRWLFSATMPDEVRILAGKYLKEPLVLSLDAEKEQHEDIVHRVYQIPSNKRFEGLVDILLFEHPSRSLVFCHTKLESIEIAQKLQDHGFNAAALQGDMTQDERNAVLASFKSGSMPCLVATNVAARGLDIQGVSHVIQLGLPDDKETFIHRSGRTGRAGHEGVNLILLSPREAGRFKAMLKGTDFKVEWRDVPGLDKIRQAWFENTEQELFASPIDKNFGEYISWAGDLLTRAEPKILIAKLLAVLSAKSQGYSLDNELEREIKKRSGKNLSQVKNSAKNSASNLHKNKSQRPKGIMKRFISSKSQNTGNILNAICTALKVERDEVGAIRFKNDCVIVELMPLAISRLERKQSKDGLAKFGLRPENKNKSGKKF